jgi:hypothetical protein
VLCVCVLPTHADLTESLQVPVQVEVVRIVDREVLVEVIKEVCLVVSVLIFLFLWAWRLCLGVLFSSPGSQNCLCVLYIMTFFLYILSSIYVR